MIGGKRRAALAGAILALTVAGTAYAAAGDLDTSFSGDGKAVFDLGITGNGQLTAEDLAIDSSGRVLTTGFDGNNDFAVTRFNTDGSLDASFGPEGTGTVRTDFGTGSADNSSDIAIDGSGKIVVAGYSDASDAGFGDMAVARYNPDGTLDTGFGTNGTATVGVAGQTDLAYAVAIDSQGRIVLGGFGTGVPNEGYAAARFETNGTVDDNSDADGGFGDGDDGYIIFPGDGGSYAQGQSVAIGAGDKVVIGGEDSTTAGLARLDANGDPDTTFGGNGAVSYDINGPVFAPQPIKSVQVSGTNILATGEIFDLGASTSKLILMRTEDDGSLDTDDGDGGFGDGDDGYILTEFEAGGGNMSRGEDLTIDSMGRAVVAGTSFTPSDRTGAVARFTADGSAVDTNFGNDATPGDGIVLYPGGNQNGNGVAIQGDGKIVSAGARNGTRIVAVRLAGGDGSLDPTWDGDGIVVTGEPGPSSDTGISTVLQSDGKLVVAGTTDIGPGADRDFLVARVLPNGTLDPAFGGGDGHAEADLSGSESDDEARGVALEPDGDIVVAGFADNDSSVARFESDGSLDDDDGDGGFGSGSDGTLLIDIGGTNDGDDAADVEAVAGGKILIGGTAQGPGVTDFYVARLTPTGALDTGGGGFAAGAGYVTTDLDGAGSDDHLNALAVEGPAGKIVAAGTSDPGGGQDFALARYTADGDLDTATFGDDGSPDDDGIVIDDFGGMGALEFVDDVAITSDGIVVAGATLAGGGTELALARYSDDGSLDTVGFGGGDGKVQTAIGTQTLGAGIVEQPDGKLVIGGTGEVGSNIEFAVLRYEGDGAPDPSFGSGGVVTTDLGQTDIGQDLELRPDGTILLAGGSVDPTTFEGGNLAVASYQSADDSGPGPGPGSGPGGGGSGGSAGAPGASSVPASAAGPTCKKKRKKRKRATTSKKKKKKKCKKKKKRRKR